MAVKKFTPISGVYRITCKVNGKSYIGSSVDIRKRWSVHRRLLSLGRHHSIHLQRAWLLLGCDAFDVEILEECDSENLLGREQYWLGLFETANDLFGYNISQKAGAPMSGLKHSAETLKKMSQSHSGRKHSEESKAKISKGNLGKKLSPEHVEQMRLSRVGKKASEETKQKLREIRKNPSAELRYKFGNGTRGKKLSRERVERGALARSQRFIVVSPDGVSQEILGLAKFCRQHGLDQGSMTKVAQGKRPNHKGWLCYRP